jgi:hypothetical protein
MGLARLWPCVISRHQFGQLVGIVVIDALEKLQHSIGCIVLAVIHCFNDTVLSIFQGKGDARDGSQRSNPPA